jgi:hypothetical protein
MPTFPSTSMLVASYSQREWKRVYNLSGSVLKYREDLYQEWECRVDTAYAGFLASTPADFAQDSFDNRFTHGSPSGVGIHTDRFVKIGADWTEA